MASHGFRTFFSVCVGEKLFLTTFEEGLLQTLALDVRMGA